MHLTSFLTVVWLTTGSTAFAGTTAMSADMKTRTTVFMGTAQASDMNELSVDLVAAMASGQTLQTGQLRAV